jgi:hypothetical protein
MASGDGVPSELASRDAADGLWLAIAEACPVCGQDLIGCDPGCWTAAKVQRFLVIAAF